MRAVIKTAFKITDRGTVIVIDPNTLEGTVKIGVRCTCPRISGENLIVEIKGVDFLDYVTEGKADIGLLVGNQVAPDEVGEGKEILDSI